MLLTAKILLTFATLGYSAIPALFDSNNTHATNPSFPGHARFHVVWQVSSYVYIAFGALYLIWTAGTDTLPLWIAAVLAGSIYLGFWTAVATRSAYGGKLLSDVNPVPLFHWNLAGRKFTTDANITIFTGALLIAFGGVLALAQA